MVNVYGTVQSFGLNPINGRELRLRFVPSSGAAGARGLLTPGYVVEATPGSNGDFSIDIAATEGRRPDGLFYRVETHWLNPTGDGDGYHQIDHLPFRVYVPLEGGSIADMIYTDSSGQQSVWVGDAPNPPSRGMWWIDASGQLKEWNGSMWVNKSQLELIGSQDVPKEQYIGNNMSIERLSWQGPVYWVTTSPSGFPVHARSGDTLWRVSDRDKQRTVYDSFARADGPAGTTEEGNLTWSAIPGVVSGATPTVASNELSISNVASGTTIRDNIVGVECGPEGYVWFRVGDPGVDRNSALMFRASNPDNYLSIAMRTSETDPEARFSTRQAGTVSVIAGLGVALVPGDVVEVQMRGPEIEILVNESTRWSGTVASNMSGRWAGFARHVNGNGARLQTFAAGVLA